MFLLFVGAALIVLILLDVSTRGGFWVSPVSELTSRERAEADYLDILKQASDLGTKRITALGQNNTSEVVAIDKQLEVLRAREAVFEAQREIERDRLLKAEADKARADAEEAARKEFLEL